MNFPTEPLAILRALEEAGYEAWIVGGAVRDALLGKVGHDVDITTNATPTEIEQVFSHHKTIDVGKAFGTVRVVFPEGVYEVTTYRSESSYRDGRHPEIVAFSRSIAEDMQRRDFTMNAMAWHPEKGLLDLFGGQADLQQGRLRAVGNPSERIAEDGLRMLRAVRFAARFSLAIDSALANAIRDNAKEIRRISEERCLDELERMLTGQHPSQAMALLVDLGLWTYLLPELDATQISYALLDQMPDEPSFRWAALGMEASRSATQDILHAQDAQRKEVHRFEAQRMQGVLRRLKSSRKRQDEVAFLLSEPQTPIPAHLSEAQRWVGRTQPNTKKMLLFMERLLKAEEKEGDHSTAHDQRVAQEALSRLHDFLGTIENDHLAVAVKDLALHGGDLIRLGIPSGPAIGTLLQHLLNLVIDGKVPNTKEALEAVCIASKKERQNETDPRDGYCL